AIAVVPRPWPQPLPGKSAMSPDRADLIAAVAQTLEGGVVLAQRIPRTPQATATGMQPLFDVGFIADQGQPPPSLFVPRPWPQPAPQIPLVGQRPRVLFASLSTGGTACFI